MKADADIENAAPDDEGTEMGAMLSSGDEELVRGIYGKLEDVATPTGDYNIDYVYGRLEVLEAKVNRRWCCKSKCIKLMLAMLMIMAVSNWIVDILYRFHYLESRLKDYGI